MRLTHTDAADGDLLISSVDENSSIRLEKDHWQQTIGKRASVLSAASVLRSLCVPGKALTGGGAA
jgi:hypothetical protein